MDSEPPKVSESKKKVDPGWNDPPMLNYSAANPPPKSRIGNKRVPFPISGNDGTSASTNNTGKTPPLNTLQGPPRN